MMLHLLSTHHVLRAALGTGPCPEGAGVGEREMGFGAAQSARGGWSAGADYFTFCLHGDWSLSLMGRREPHETVLGGFKDSRLKHWRSHSLHNECLARPAPGSRDQRASTELIFELGKRQACEPNTSRNALELLGPVEKALGWEPNSAPKMFCVLGQVTPLTKLLFSQCWISRLSPWSPRVLAAWVSCDSLSSGPEVSSPV